MVTVETVPTAEYKREFEFDVVQMKLVITRASEPKNQIANIIDAMKQYHRPDEISTISKSAVVSETCKRVFSVARNNRKPTKANQGKRPCSRWGRRKRSRALGRMRANRK